jgi:hypothetical protein
LVRRILTLSVLCLLAGQAWGYLDVPFDQLKKAAEAGDPESQNKMGVLYGQGIGLPKDKVKAYQWYMKAAAAKFPPAMWNLAFMYVRGEGGVKEDMTVAFGLFREAAELGYVKAQYDTGFMYLQGLGIAQNTEEGMKWLNKAAEQGDHDAKKLLEDLKAMENNPQPMGHPSR